MVLMFDSLMILIFPDGDGLFLSSSNVIFHKGSEKYAQIGQSGIKLPIKDIMSSKPSKKLKLFSKFFTYRPRVLTDLILKN